MRLRKKPWISKALEEYKGKELLTEKLEENRGSWRTLFAGKPLALEIGCGKGDFLAGMAELHPDRAFLGMEVQQEICYYPVKKIREKELSNAKVISGNAEQLTEWFAPGEVEIIYLNFSDPWPKARHAKRRLTYRSFLTRYQQVLPSGGHLRFKTDNLDLFKFSLEEFKAFGLEIIELSYDLHNSVLINEVQTEYEKKFSAKGNKINFCEVVFK